MIATTDEPCFTAQNTATPPRSRRPWTPDDNDHLIYHWIKFEGKTQDWVAQAFDIHQSTVSRIIERYERWQAHAKERENGRLDPSERLRAQRWLTFERNERILASCLRIAHEMEGFCDVSQSVTTYNHKDPTKQADVRTVHSVMDRHGIASRFLRLAHRINMEQLKLAEADQPPPARELTDEEFEAEERQAAADAAEFAAAQAASHARIVESMARKRAERPATPDPVGWASPTTAHDLATRVPPGSAPPRGSSLAESPDTLQPAEPVGWASPTTVQSAEPAPPDLATRVPPGSAPPRGSSLAEPPETQQPAESEPAASPTRQEPRDTGFPGGSLGTSDADALPSVGEAHPTTHHSPDPAPHKTHNLHTQNAAISRAAPCTCVLELTAEKISYKPCIIDCEQPPWPAEAIDCSTSNRLAAVAAP